MSRFVRVFRRVQRALNYTADMTLRRKKELHELRRARRVVEQDNDSDQGTFVAPAKDECHEEPLATFPSEPDSFVRIQGATWRAHERMVNFYIAVQVQRSFAGDWETMLTIDCMHGHVHAHPYREGSKGQAVHIHRLDSVVDLKKGLGLAIAYAQDTASRLNLKED